MQCSDLSPRRLNLCPDCINFHPSLLPKHRGCWSASQLGPETVALAASQKWLDCAGQASGAFLRATPRQVSHATAWWRPHAACCAEVLGAQALFRALTQAFDAGLVLHQERIVVDWSPGNVRSPEHFGQDKRLRTRWTRPSLPRPQPICSRFDVVPDPSAGRFTGSYYRFVRYFSSEGLPAGEEQKGESSYHYRKLPFDGLVQPDWSDQQVARFIRAMEFPPFDGAAVLVDGKRVLVDSVEAYRSLMRGAGAAPEPAPQSS
ncbi:wbkC [Symbiodinium sp. CCMP2592]|nr:wbkC [Symbiodinium sp. CCMP2592]